MKVLNDNFAVKKAYMTAVHAVTASQSLVDGPKKALREGRAAYASIIPASTGAADAVVRVLPELKDRITGAAFRVPVLCGSVLEVVATVAKETSVEKINEVFKKAASGNFKNIIETNDEGLVSTDIIGTAASAIVDLPLTEVLGDFVRVVAWYDNEYAYAVRLIDLVEFIGGKF